MTNVTRETSVKHWTVMPIGGVWKEGFSEASYTVTNPYNEESLAQIKLANKEDIDAAYKGAKKAQKEWELTTPDQKSAIFERAIQLINERREEIVDLLVKETGSTLLKANVEVDLTVADLKQSATFPFKMAGKTIPSTVPGKENRLYRIPEGVVGIITPWNWPFTLALRAIGPALATGNSVVIKPDLQTPITGGLIIAEIFEQAGLPKGVLNVVVADIKEIGDSFITHSIPRVIAFTGSTEAGRHIGGIAASHVKKPLLELGGNNPFIVLDDADIEDAVNSAIFGKFMHNGQICMSINRILVDQKIYKPFVKRLKERVSQLKVGNPEEMDTVIGPLINQSQIKKIINLIDESVREGAKVELQGSVEGNVMSPFIITDVKSEMKIAQSEIFGPVVTIIPFEGDQEAVRIANDTEYGLTGGVYSGSIDRGLHVANQIETGMIHVNDSSVNAETITPFGGVKQSGLGRFHGDEITLEEFTTIKWVSVQNTTRQFPF